MSDNKKAKDLKTKADKAKGKSESKDKPAAAVDLGFLEEDDDFEEFVMEPWDTKKTGDAKLDDATLALAEDGEEDRVNIWEDDWDDDQKEEDLTKQLQAEMVKRKAAKIA